LHLEWKRHNGLKAARGTIFSGTNCSHENKKPTRVSVTPKTKQNAGTRAGIKRGDIGRLTQPKGGWKTVGLRFLTCGAGQGSVRTYPPGAAGDWELGLARKKIEGVSLTLRGSSKGLLHSWGDGKSFRVWALCIVHTNKLAKRMQNKLGRENNE